MAMNLHNLPIESKGNVYTARGARHARAEVRQSQAGSDARLRSFTASARSRRAHDESQRAQVRERLRPFFFVCASSQEEGQSPVNDAVSLFFPMYNEEGNIDQAVASALAVLAKVSDRMK
jgi:hypothetical protein